MEDYLEILENSEGRKKNDVKLKEHKNLFDNYFQGTAKLWKKYDTKNDLIKRCNIGRIFLKNDKPSYFEVFEEPRAEIMGISKKISLLYAPLEQDNDNYDKNKCIGFRYYEKCKLDNCNYFTLVRKYGKKFFILEKDKNFFDIKNEEFYDEKLDCYSIMRNIVFEKNKKENVTPKGEIFPEIFGFAYSLTSLGKFKGFTAIEPLVLEPLNEETQIEQLPEVLENNIGYIEPIIFDSHISVVIIKKAKINKRGRLNIILDMSRYHVEENLLDNTIFPEEFYFNNYSYPNFSIQKGNSCGLWFYGIIECIYSNVKYKNIDDVCSSIDNYRTDFFIDVINCLSNCLFGIPDIIDNSCIETSLNIKETRIYELGQLSTYSFRKEAIKSYYFSLASLFAYYEGSKVNYDAKLNGIELLLEYQYLIDNIKNFLSLVIFNDNYFKAYSSKEIYEKKQKYEYQILIQKLKKLLSKVNQSYDKEFNKSLYEQFEDYLNHGISDYKEKVTNAYLKLKSTIPQNNNNNIIDINILKKEFDVIKNSKKKVALKEESTIIKYLNPNSEFYFQMLIH